MKKLLISALLGFLALSVAYADLEQKAEKIFTVNMDPLVMLLGFYYVTLDVKFADHFIWGNALLYRNGQLSLIDSLRTRDWGLGYTIGLAYFPFDPLAEGFHLAVFFASLAVFGEGDVYYSPTLGTYLGYSFHFFETIKLSLKLGGMYSFENNLSAFPEGDLAPHISFEIGYMF